MSVLLSIKPEFAEKIMTGEKRFEFRRVVPKRDVGRVVVYASSPVRRIVGEFTVRRVVSDRPKALWRLARSHAGISKSYFDAYFEGRDEAHAFEIGSVLRYGEPIDPKGLRLGFRPPQSFLYLDSLEGFESRLRLAA